MIFEKIEKSQKREPNEKNDYRFRTQRTRITLKRILSSNAQKKSSILLTSVIHDMDPYFERI